jgi:hypothetical protein
MTLLTPHSGDEHDIREATAELLDYEPGALRKHLFKMRELGLQALSPENLLSAFAEDAPHHYRSDPL